MKHNRMRACMLATLLALCLLAPAAQAENAGSGAYRVSRYFEGQYTAYASAVRPEGGPCVVEVFLQMLPGFTPASPIASYNLYAGGALLGNAAASQAGASMPLYFRTEVELPSGIQSLRLVPVLALGGENPAEEIDLMPEIAPGSHVGTVGVVRNPNPEDRLNLRVAPDSGGESLRHYSNGVPVNILAEQADGWVAVSIGAEGGMARGYMKADFLVFGEEAAKVESAIPSHEAIVSSWSLYRFPEEYSDVLATYGEGERFEVLGQSTAWWHIRVGDKTGFVRADVLITPPPAELTVADLPQQGQRMVVVGQDGAIQEMAEGAAGERPAIASGAEAEDTEPSAGLRYAAERRLERGYTVNALVQSAGVGQYDVIVHVLRDPGSAIGDTLTGFRLFAGDMQIGADASLDWAMDTSAGESSCYRALVSLMEAPTAMRIVPVWEQGGAMEEESIALTAK